jgi:hypothetical protein
MNQRLVLHIFRKDVRQHWLSILFSLAVQVLFTWNEQLTLALHGVPVLGFRARLSPFLPVALIIGWSVLIVRSIQSEAPAGIRQYWITRPVEWKELLAAKALLMVAFVELPLLMANIDLLMKSGLPATLHTLPCVCICSCL